MQAQKKGPDVAGGHGRGNNENEILYRSTPDADVQTLADLIDPGAALRALTYLEADPPPVEPDPEPVNDYVNDPNFKAYRHPEHVQRAYLTRRLRGREQPDGTIHITCPSCEGTITARWAGENFATACAHCNAREHGAWRRVTGMERWPDNHNLYGDKILCGSASPRDLADHFLEMEYPGGTLRFWRDQFYAYTKDARQPYAYDLHSWKYLPLTALQSQLGDALSNWGYIDAKDNYQPVRPKVKDALVRDVVGQLKRGSTMLPDALDTPFWTDGRADGHDWIALQNGLLHIPTRKLHRSTEELFTLNVLPFEYDPDADCEAWIKFLESSLPGDDGVDKALLLAEFFGYVLSPRCHRDKMLWLVGPPGSGKGTCQRVLTALVGAENTADPQLSTFGGRYNLHSLVGKKLAIFADAQEARLDGAIILERLKKLTGGDRVEIERKFLPALNVRLPIKMLFGFNPPVPKLPDAAGAMMRRVLCIDFTVSFQGIEDLTLGDRLEAELPGILNWSLAGLARLEQRGTFTRIHSEHLADFRAASNPVRAFVEEKCALVPGASVRTEVLYEHWCRYCNDEGIHPGSARWFGGRLKAAYPQVARTRLGASDCAGKRIYVYPGIVLL